MTFANSWPWIAGAVGWLLWFTVWEIKGLHDTAHTIAGKTTPTLTLSRFMWYLGQKWPPFLVLYGGVALGLAVHFWWNWCPALGSVNG